jgi:hypothetical protein
VYKQVDAQSVTACVEECQQDGKCRAATFVKPEVERKGDMLLLPPKRAAFCLEYDQLGDVIADDLAKGKFVHIKKSCETTMARKPGTV